jgi:hypothetical protein
VAEPGTLRRQRIRLPISRASGGVLPGVDLNRSNDLEEVMGKRDPA